MMWKKKMNEVFVIEPSNDFNVTRLGQFNQVNTNMSDRSHNFYGSVAFSVRDISKGHLLDHIFLLKDKLFIVGKLDMIEERDGINTFYITPASKADIARAIKICHSNNTEEPIWQN